MNGSDYLWIGVLKKEKRGVHVVINCSHDFVSDLEKKTEKVVW